MSEEPTKSFPTRHRHTLDLFDFRETELPEDRWLRFAVRLAFVLGLSILVYGAVAIVLLAMIRLLLR